MAAHDGKYGGCVRQLYTPTSTGLHRQYSSDTKQEVTAGARASVEDQLAKVVAQATVVQQAETQPAEQ